MSMTLITSQIWKEKHWPYKQGVFTQFEVWTL
jgi:hypothetical protein